MRHETLHAETYPRPTAFLFRHAERDPFTSAESAFTAQLTEKGHREAFELGKELARYSPILFHHSPVERCRQTVEDMAAGVTAGGGSSEIRGAIETLGGPYIVGDWERIVDMVVAMGNDAFLRKWFDGDVEPGILLPLPAAAEQQLGVLAAQLARGDEVTVNVSHDWNLMLIREHFFGLRHDDIDLPPFLDGIAASRNGAGLSLNYHGRRITAPAPRA